MSRHFKHDTLHNTTITRHSPSSADRIKEGMPRSLIRMMHSPFKVARVESEVARKRLTEQKEDPSLCQ